MFSRLFFLNLQYQNYRKLIGQVFFCELQKIFDHIVILRRRTLNETLIFFCQMKFPINLVIAPNVVRFIANTTLPRYFFTNHFKIFVFYFLNVVKTKRIYNLHFLAWIKIHSKISLVFPSNYLFKQKFVLSHYDVKHTKH